MNIILTPVYKSYDIVAKMCDAIDRCSVMQYKHILIDDSSSEIVPATSYSDRRWLQIHRNVPNVVHKNGLGQALQLGLEYARMEYENESPNQPIDHVFVIESDVIVQEEGWDKKQIEISQTLPDDWGTLDIQSVDEEGKVTYPCTVSPCHGYTRPDLEHLHYPDFQVTLFSSKTLFENKLRFSNAPSHFDVLFGRRMETLGLKAYRTTLIKALHVNGGGNSRQYLV